MRWLSALSQLAAIALPANGDMPIYAKTLKSLASISTVPFDKSGAIDCNSMITDVRPLDEITGAFEALSGNAPAMKSLINVLNSELLMCRKISELIIDNGFVTSHLS
jgi:hypothetical protein